VKVSPAFEETAPVNPQEIGKLEAYLRRVFGSPKLAVKARGKEDADLMLGADKLGDISKDEDEGELSYFVNVGVARAPGAKKDAPIDDAERVRLQGVLKEKIASPQLQVRARPRKTDSTEVYVGEEFIGTLSRDEESKEFGFFLTMSILDIDLDDD
jgi:hypothetical protein